MTFDLEAFRRAYASFLDHDRVLLSGHSHQAWPDVARAAQMAYFDDSARFVDEKWERAVFPKMESVQRRLLARMGLPETDALTFGKSTHELLVRLLTCLRWSKKPRVVTTTSEFHSLHRQLSRLSEEGVEVVWVDATERATLAERLLDALRERTDMLAMSAVLFEDAYVVSDLGAVLQKAVDAGAIAVVDAYHAFNVVPLDLGPAVDHVFVTAGGYKYAQFGEGVCWLRAPSDSTLRPIDTGWFADFGALVGPRSHQVGYGPGGQRFAGATFDGSAIYRADAVLAHFDSFRLDVPALRAISTAQTARLLELLRDHGVLSQVTLRSSLDARSRGGFVALETPHAAAIVQALRARGVSTDARGDVLRLGPAPYTRDEELVIGVEHLTGVLHELAPR